LLNLLEGEYKSIFHQIIISFENQRLGKNKVFSPLLSSIAIHVISSHKDKNLSKKYLNLIISQISFSSLL